MRRESDGSGIRESLIQALPYRRFFVLTDEERSEAEAGDEPDPADEEDDWTDDTDEEDWATSLAEADESSPPEAPMTQAPAAEVTPDAPRSRSAAPAGAVGWAAAAAAGLGN